MLVGTLEIALRLPGCRSLKDKRQVIRSILEKLRRQFHVSAAEVGDHDLWGNATLGIATVGSHAATLESALQKIVDVIEASPDVTVHYESRSITQP